MPEICHIDIEFLRRNFKCSFITRCCIIKITFGDRFMSLFLWNIRDLKNIYSIRILTYLSKLDDLLKKQSKFGEKIEASRKTKLL